MTFSHFSDFSGLSVNENMSIKDNAEAIIGRVSHTIWRMLNTIFVERTNEQMLETHSEILDCMYEEFKNEKGLSMGAQAESIFYKIGCDTNHPDHKGFTEAGMLNIAQIAFLYALDAISIKDQVKQINYIGRAWLYTGMFMGDYGMQEQFQSKKSEKMREIVTNRHKRDAPEKEALRLKVIEQWEKGNPNTGTGWPTIEAATTYLIDHIAKPYSTIRSWISAHEKSKRTKEDV